MTLVELLIAGAMFAVILGGALQVLISSLRSHDAGVAVLDVETQVSRTLQRIAWELTGCSVNVLDPKPAAPASTSSLTYQQVDDFDGDDIVWHAAGRIELQMEEGELDDGFDNDGDGLVDEGRVVWVSNAGLPSELEAVTARNVRRLLEGEEQNGLDDNGNGLIDEPGLSFDLRGEELTIRLSLERPGPGKTTITRTSETTIKLRNP